MENESAENQESESSSQLRKKINVTEHIRNNPWIVSTFVLGLFVVILVAGSFSTEISGSTVSEDKAADILLSFASQQGVEFDSVNIMKESGLYRVDSEGGEIIAYLTLDGKYLINGLLPLSVTESSVQNDSEESGFSEQDNLDIQQFSQCIADKGFRVYAADWCPHCEDLKTYFGGQQNVEPFWIVCSDISHNPTENAALCSAEGITGYPTMKFNGQVLSIPRTFDAIAEATGCPAPQLS